MELKPGMTIFLPAGVRHHLVNPGPEPIRCRIFSLLLNEAMKVERSHVLATKAYLHMNPHPHLLSA